MIPYVLTRSANQDLNDIWDHIAQDSPNVADRVLSAIEVAMAGLGGNPGIGHFREDLAHRRYRFFLIYSYLVVYRWQTKPIRVIRILHAARDVRELLRPVANEPFLEDVKRPGGQSVIRSETRAFTSRRHSQKRIMPNHTSHAAALPISP